MFIAITGFLVGAHETTWSTRSPTKSSKVLITLGVVYCGLQYFSGSGTLEADRILVETAIVFTLPNNRVVRKLLLARLIIGTALGRFVDPNCDGSWYTFASLKSDAINQPFPFTPVWHLAQLPDSITRILSVLIVATELTTPVILVLSRSGSSLESACAGTILFLNVAFYGIIGNFNWCILVVFSLCVSLVSPSVVTLLVGKETFVRWGLEIIDFNDSEAESDLIKSIASWSLIALLVSIVSSVIVFVFDYNIHELLAVFSFRFLGPLVLGMLLFIGLMTAVKESAKLGDTKIILPVVVILGGVIYNGSAFSSVLTGGLFEFQNDYSGLPTCYTFSASEGNFPTHSSEGRAAFLFQTKYSVIGTNTVGSNLGGTRYAELSVPGSVHADEHRPPFLLGHLPRIALTLWRTGTGNIENIKHGLGIMQSLSDVIRNGGKGIEVFFPDADDKVVTALESSKKNEVRSFYQSYGVTNRAADHQWWKRNYDDVSALPELSGSVKIDTNCTPILPSKILGYNLEMILITGLLGMIVLRILLTRPNKAANMTKKSK